MAYIVSVLQLSDVNGLLYTLVYVDIINSNCSPYEEEGWDFPDLFSQNKIGILRCVTLAYPRIKLRRVKVVRFESVI